MNDCHLNNDQCVKEAERKWYREEDMQGRTERAFQAYIRPLNLVK